MGRRTDSRTSERRSRQLRSCFVGTFDQLIDKLDADSGVKGHQFERIAKWFLMNDPAYKSLLRRVWLWKEWSDRWSDAEAGIDIVAEDFSGNLWAVQCKAYRADRTITKADIDKFLSESSRPVFTERLLIATTDNIHRVARNTMSAQQKNVAIVGLDALRLTDSYLDWPDSPDELRPPRPSQPARPHDYQLEAIKDVVEGFKAGDRGQLIMACGTGKTLTALFIRDKLAAGRTLVLVPSLSLLKQTMKVWQTSLGGEPPFKSLPVCSDATVSRAEEDAPVAHTSDLGVPVTTDPAEIAAFLRKRGPRVVFATYQSSPQIAKAFELVRVPAFDLVVADEGHRCAGPVSSDFATILDGSKIRARHRLFMTATPRYFTGRVLRAARESDFEYASMDDEAKFGPEFHKLSFSKAIERKLLTDYQVAVVGVDDATFKEWAERGALVTLDGVEITDARTLAGQIGLAKAMRKYDLRRTISFHSRVARAREFADSIPTVIDWMPSRQRPKGTLWTGHASGAMSAGQRHILIQHLERLDDGERGLLANARCLAEGVDVPTLDGVAFIDPRQSEVDIVQAVGRAIRKSDDKTIGTIVIPVFIDRETDPETALDSSVFRPVWDVVKALRAHDEELGKQLDNLRRELGKKGGRPRLPDKIHQDLPARVGIDFARAFEVRLVNETTASWEFWFGLLQQFVELNGHARVLGRFRTVDGYRLGQWVTVQRTKYNNGTLDADRAGQLKGLPGWTWDRHVDRWEEGFRRLVEYVARHGDACPPASGTVDSYRLGAWVRMQRISQSKGTLDADRQQRLQDLSGWTWDSRAAQWEEGFRRLQHYVERHGDARVADSYTVDRHQLGKWVGKQRTSHVKGTLEADRERRLQVLPGWIWDILEDQWEQAFRRLQQYVETHGHARVPPSYKIDDCRLGAWVSQQRGHRSKSSLDADRERRLQDLSRWTRDSRAAKWEEGFSELLDYVELNGHARVPQSYTTADGYPLGTWVYHQRAFQRKGSLDADRESRLQGLAGWTWTAKQSS
jgi:superfamily II DNA or RNA helicase